MNCPACGSRKTEVLATRRTLSNEVERQRQCVCGVRWGTVERLVRSSINTTRSLPVAHRQTTGDPPVTTSSPPVAVGGVGGGLPSGLISVPDPAPSGSVEARSEKKAKVMSPPAYSPHFECFWNHSDKLGSKSDAHRAWNQVGRPAADQLMASRRDWLAHWQGIGVKHIATWLRAFDWQQDPAPRQQALVPAARQSKNGQVVAAVLAMNAGGKL